MKNKIIFKTLMLKGEAGSTIVSMEKTGHVGTADIYTITFNDGSTTEISLENMSAITSVEKTSSTDTEDIYTITCADGSTQTFSVLNHNADIAALSASVSADLSDMDNEIDTIDARVDNFINSVVPDSVETLWTGSLGTRNQPVTLSKSVSEFDFIDIYTLNGADTTFTRVPANVGTANIHCGNLSDDASVDFFYYGEMGITLSGNQATLTKAVAFEWTLSGGTVVDDTTVAVVTRIDGVRIASNTPAELADVRVGADGVTYGSAGAAVRGQISDLKEDLTSVIVTSKNIYDYENDDVGLVISADGTETINAQYRTSKHIYLDPGKVFTFLPYNTLDSNGAVMMASYSSDGTFLSRYGFNTGNTREPITYTLKSNEYSVRLISFVNSAPFMANLGTELLEYTPYGVSTVEHFTMEDGSIKSEFVDFVKISDNLFDADAVSLYKTFDTSNNTIAESLTNFCSNPIRLEQGVYTVGNATQFRITCMVDATRVFSLVVTSNDGFTFFATAKMRFYISGNIALLNSITLKKGYSAEGHTDYHTPYLSIPVQTRDLLYKWSDKPISTDYEPVTVKNITVSGEDFNYQTVQASDVFSKFDELVTAFPDYVTRTFLGYDASGELPIYEYDFYPEKVPTASGTDRTLPYPKILITSGMHGMGDAGDTPIMPCGLYYTFYDICHNWRSNELLEYLRWNIKFAVIPISNPWGFNNKNRRNSHLVDINRNFGYHWAAGTEGSYSYGGTKPWSEAETVILRNFIMAHSDAVAHTDFHSTAGVQEQAHMCYVNACPQTPLLYPAQDLIQTLTRLWDNGNYGGLEEGDLHGYIVDAVAGTIDSWTTNVAKIPSVIIEGFPNYEDSTETIYGENIMKMVLEEIGNWIFAMIRYLKASDK